MSNEDLEQHLKDAGFTVERITGQDNQPYLVIRKYQVPAGRLAGQVCDVAVQRTEAVPYVMPPAIHTHPALIPMGERNTQASGVGPGWQYLSRTLRVQPSPETIVAHIATVLAEV